MPFRPTPFDLVFADLAPQRFPGLRDSLARGQVDPRNRDAFLLDREVAQLLRDVVPEEGVGEAIDQHIALLHTAYLFWDGGRRSINLTELQARQLFAEKAPADGGGNGFTDSTFYVQFPERLVWAQIAEGKPHEPLDGLFVAPAIDPASLRVLGIFGIYNDRPGFSIAEATGPRPRNLTRSDMTPLFAPALPGGSAAGLHSVTGTEELLELGARAIQAVPLQ